MMKKSLISLALLAVLSSAMAHDSTASASGSNVVTSTSVASVTASGPGSAISQVGNVGYASNTVGVSGDASGGLTGNTSGNWCNPSWSYTDTRQGSVGVTGKTETYNRTDVYTSQSGNATSFGAASGVASANASGNGSFYTVSTGPQGNVTGSSSALSATGAISVGNGSSTQSGGMVSGFDVGASADRTKTANGKGSTTLNSSDVKNAATHVTAFAVGNSYISTSSGSAIGVVIDNGNASGLANASVAGVVSASK